jgi:hypothetical protein
LLLEDAADLLDTELDDERFETDGDLPSLLLELISIMLLDTSGSNILSSFVLVTSWLGSGY